MKKQMLSIECNDGIHTEAQYFENGKLLATSSAKKHPDDKHNFWTGVDVAISRLPHFNLETDLKTGMFVRICDCWYLLVEGFLISRFGRLINYNTFIINPLIDMVVEANAFEDCLKMENVKILYFLEGTF